MSEVYSFRPAPSYRGASRQEMFDAALDTPLSRTSTFLDQAKGGALESFGLGTVLRDITTPQGNEPPSLIERSLAQVPQIPLGVGYSALKAVSQSFLDQGTSLNEEAYKASASYRKDIPWDAGMTDTRAAALAAMDDAKKVREFYAQKRPFVSFLGNMAGQALDPINYVPVAGPLVKAAAIGRFGRIAGEALTAAADAASNTAVFGAVTADTRAKYGDDVSWQSTVSQIATAALIGGAFGTIAGAAGRHVDARIRSEAETRLSTLRTTQESLIALNEGIDGIANGNDIRLSPNSTEPMARVASELGAKEKLPVVSAIEPPVPEGMVRVYHSGSVGGGDAGRWVSSNRRYAADYRGDLPLHYLDLPADDPRINNADIPEQGIREGFTFNFETTPQEAATLKEISREQPPKDLLTPETSSPAKAAEAPPVASDSSLNRTASWVLRDKVTKKPVMETFNPDLVDRLNTDKYEAVPIGQYLGEINGKPKTPAAIDTSTARPEPAPEGIKQAEASIAKPDDAKALASQYRVDPQTGSFHEEAEVQQLAAEGRLTETDAATMAQAQSDFETGSAYAEALKSVAGCLL